MKSLTFQTLQKKFHNVQMNGTSSAGLPAEMNISTIVYLNFENINASICINFNINLRDSTSTGTFNVTNSQDDQFPDVLIAQLVEHCTGFRGGHGFESR